MRRTSGFFCSSPTQVPLTDHVHRFKVVLYDLSKNVRFTITDNWDRSPDALAVSSSMCYVPCKVWVLIMFVVLQRRQDALLHGGRRSEG